MKSEPQESYFIESWKQRDLISFLMNGGMNMQGDSMHMPK